MAVTAFPVNFGGKTYDIKDFLRDHPGGTNTLKYYQGKNILDAMEKFGHSSGAYHMLNDFKVKDSVIGDGNLTGNLSENGRIVTKDEAKRNVEEIEFLEELEAKLDWSQPMVGQLQKIAPSYHQWVNSPVYRPLRLFRSQALESLTFIPWYIVPMVWVPIISILGVYTFIKYVFCRDFTDNFEPCLSVNQYLYHLAIGLFIWTILEYSLHRWVFHLDPGSSILLIKFHFLIHGLHHKVPFDGYRQVFPPVPAMMICAIIYYPISLIFNYSLIKLVGGLVGYLSYDMIHYYVHHGAPKAGSYLYEMKRYHSNHHFVNHDKAFGISNNFWDHIFKTFVKVKKLGFSLKW